VVVAERHASFDAAALHMGSGVVRDDRVADVCGRDLGRQIAIHVIAERLQGLGTQCFPAGLVDDLAGRVSQRVGQFVSRHCFFAIIEGAALAQPFDQVRVGFPRARLSRVDLRLTGRFQVSQRLADRSRDRGR